MIIENLVLYKKWGMKTMNKKEAINVLIKTIYNTNSNLILSEIDIKNLNCFFKDINDSQIKIEDFFNDNSKEFNKISKLKSGKYEIEKQFIQKKALQPGILSECNYIETLAKIFKLNKCLDFDRTPINKVPIECRKYLNSGYQTFSAARYLYYSTKNSNIFIFQYGNPANGDAEIIIDGNKIRIEFKERNAKAGEYDITGLYNDQGKLLISDDFRKNTPEYIPLIEKFNRETSVIEQIGHNYNNFDDETKDMSIMEYFSRHHIDVIISSTSDNDLIVLTPECVKKELPNGRRIITTESSEIRTSGRNHRKVFTKALFEKILKNMNAIQIDEKNYEVSLKNDLVEIVNGRGTKNPSRVKLNKLFFVDIKNAKIENDRIIFNIDNVEQLKPSISMHIKINATKSELKQCFDNDIK